MARRKRASMREGPLADLFRSTGDPDEPSAAEGSDPEQPTAPGLAGLDAIAELEGPAAAGQQATAHDERETVEDEEEQRCAGRVQQPLPQRHPTLPRSRVGTL